MIYLASPYSSPDKLVKKTRYLVAQEVTAILINEGHFVWSPIVHFYEIAQRFSLPDDAIFWKNYNFDFIRRSDKMFILDIAGWRESKGVKMEIELAHTIGLPMFMVDTIGLFTPFTW